MGTINRRGLITGAAGLVVASGAGLIVPERKIWALGWWQEPNAPVLDKAMFDREVERLYQYYKRSIELHIITGQPLPADVEPYFGVYARRLRQDWISGDWKYFA